MIVANKSKPIKILSVITAISVISLVVYHFNTHANAAALLKPLTKHEKQQSRTYDMSFAGFNATCLDSLPTTNRLEVKIGEPIRVTYNVCCSTSRTGCWTAALPLLLTGENLAAVEAAGVVTADLTEVDLNRTLAFVTGSSANHYEESLSLITSIQTHFPGSKTLYWDLGLSQDQANKVKTFCGVKYQRFNFSRYPQHVATLTTYAFKPLAIMESLMEYPALWWVDSSIRFTSSNLTEVFKLTKERHGLLLFEDPGHSVFSTTYPQMFEYIGTDVEKLKITVTAPGGTFIVVNTKELYSTILYWFYACVLDVRCIAPVSYPSGCSFKGMNTFANCHRFDQSLLTILAANVWGFNNDGYRSRHGMFDISRGPGLNTVKFCQN